MWAPSVVSNAARWGAGFGIGAGLGAGGAGPIFPAEEGFYGGHEEDQEEEEEGHPNY